IGKSAPGSPLPDATRIFTLSKKVATIEDEFVEAQFDAETGALIGLKDKQTGWQAQQRSELGRSFRAFFANPQKRFNPVEGNLQKLGALQIDDDRRGIQLRWREESESNSFPFTFNGRVRLQDGRLHFSGELTNLGPYQLETLSWPIIGDFTRPEDATTLVRESLDYGTLRQTPIFPSMKNERGYWGTNHPIQMEGKGPSAPVITGGIHLLQRFMLLSADTQGLYFGVHDPTANRMTCFSAELRPGCADSYRWRTPAEPTINGLPVYLVTEVIHYLFAAENETITLPEVVLAFYQGDWQSGIQPYLEWRKKAFAAPITPSWLDEVHAWQQLQIGGAEDDLRTSFSELPKRATALAQNGVTALQLVGWNHGGQDRGNPSHDPDPRLGSWEDLQKAIRQIEGTGVHVVLFNKYVWADLTRPNYSELTASAALDPYGIPYQHPGYEYQTPVQLMSINTRRFAVACLNDERWLELCLAEFQKSIDLGASGILYDEAFHHWSATHCFANYHHHRVPATLWSGDLTLAQRFQERVKSKSFLLAAEAPFDLEQQYYGLSYFRISPGHIPVERFVDPFYPIMIAVCGFDDREMINRALLYRYIISYEPFNFKGDLTDFPLTLDYGKQIDALRRRYSDYLWHGVYRHHLGVTLSSPIPDSIDYSVFFQPETGKRAVILINDALDKDITVEVAFESPVPTGLVFVTPEDPEPRPCDPKKIPVKHRSATVLLQN
ncbi:MAG: hypothetical protein JO333_04540, partial [Verrucomicrobia bacterium]|nr:hypothetical protein [Verrucomicrobiota bacterium]